jgi:hypothetical protein
MIKKALQWNVSVVAAVMDRGAASRAGQSVHHGIMNPVPG